MEPDKKDDPTTKPPEWDLLPGGTPLRKRPPPRPFVGDDDEDEGES